MTDDCHRAQESLAAGEVPPPATSTHLATCLECARFMRDLARLRGAAAGLPRPPAPPVREAAPTTWRWRPVVAAGVLVGAALLLVLRPMWAPRPTSPAPAVAEAAAPPGEAVDLMASLTAVARMTTLAPDDDRLTLDLDLDLDHDGAGAATAVDPLAELRPVELLIALTDDQGDPP